MSRKNAPHDVFKYINMHNGDRTPCWEWKGSFGGRDQRPYFSAGGIKHLAYRLVYELVVGTIPKDKPLARHTCDNGTDPIGCCNPYHIVLGTQQDNMNDMKERDRHGLGRTAIRAIKKLLSEGQHTHEAIAKLYGVSRESITHINNGRVGSHVKDDDDGN